MTTIQFRRGTAAAWTSANPVLASGEPGRETDTGKLKIGDGSTAWTSLPYLGGDGLTQVHKSSDQSLPNATWTVVTWDVEDRDTYGLHDNVTNNTRLTIPTGMGGAWLFVFNAAFGASVTNDRYAAFRKNGVELLGRATSKGQTYTEIALARILEVAAGDYIEAAAYQDSGSTLTLYASTPIGNILTARRIGAI